MVILGMAVLGLGLGLFVARLTTASSSARRRPHRRGIASGVLAAARNVGMVLGVGLAGAFYTTTLAELGPDAVPQGLAHTLRLLAALTLLAAVASWRRPASELAAVQASAGVTGR